MGDYPQNIDFLALKKRHCIVIRALLQFLGDFIQYDAEKPVFEILFCLKNIINDILAFVLDNKNSFGINPIDNIKPPKAEVTSGINASVTPDEHDVLIFCYLIIRLHNL